MSSITTMVYDTGAPQGGKPTDDFSRAIVGLESVRNVTITLAYDNSGAQTERVGIHSVVTTCTYVDSGYSGLENQSRATCSNPTRDGSLEYQLIAKLLTLLRNRPQTGQPLWWHVWEMVAEDSWLHSQQIAIGRRFVRQPQALEEMCQESIFHLGRLFEPSPSLGLELDELPSKLGRRIRLIIRRDFITWLRASSRQDRWVTPWPTRDVGKLPSLSPADQLELSAAMTELAAVQRDVVEMRSHGCQRAEIARLLNLSIYQVDRIFSSCQAHLRRRLRDFRP